MIRLGQKVKDRITGLTGIVVARIEWLNGCVRIVVQPQELHDGKPVEASTFDEPSLDIVEEKAAEHTPQPGGSRDDSAALRR